MGTRTTMVVGTSAGVLGVDQLAPTVNWILDGCHTPRPDSTAVLIASILVVGATAAWHAIQASAATPAGSPVVGADPQPNQEIKTNA